MIISRNTRPQQALQNTFEELKKGASDSRHPFRYLSLASHNIETNEPNIRMVILREINDDWRLLAYTDGRTQKVQELNQLNKAALLFWHSYHKTQLTLKAEVRLHRDDELARQCWEQDVHGHAQKAYTPLVTPGTQIDNPRDAHKWPENHSSEHFCVLECIPFDMQILQINGKEHRRLSFERDIGEDSWKGHWIAP